MSKHPFNDDTVAEVRKQTKNDLSANLILDHSAKVGCNPLHIIKAVRKGRPITEFGIPSFLAGFIC